MRNNFTQCRILPICAGLSQTPPAQCVRTHTISNEDDIYIMPGVVNCFLCNLPGTISWRVEENRDLVSPSQSPNAEAVGNFLVIASPDNYVTPGTAGRRDIVCTSQADGQNYEVRLASPSKSIAITKCAYI